jgi:hypothetical protein
MSGKRSSVIGNLFSLLNKHFRNGSEIKYRGWELHSPTTLCSRSLRSFSCSWQSLASFSTTIQLELGEK